MSHEIVLPRLEWITRSAEFFLQCLTDLHGVARAFHGLHPLPYEVFECGGLSGLEIGGYGRIFCNNAIHDSFQLRGILYAQQSSFLGCIAGITPVSGAPRKKVFRTA